MPRGDRTGPNGMGPMTGRGAGFCAGFQVPGFMSAFASRGFNFCRGFGRGFGFGRGGGFGWRNRFYASGIPGSFFAGAGANAFAPQPASADERVAMESYAKSLEAELDEIRRRLDEMQQAAPKP